MLTATYTLVALSVEQTNMRVSLQAVQQLVQKAYARQSALTQAQAGYVCDTLRQLYEACQRRKLDIYVLPALRRAGAGADPLLSELDMLSRDAAAALDAACGMRDDGIADEEAVDTFCSLVERFCMALTLRFEREERELFPVARVAIGGEDWFAVANQMLAHEAGREERRGHEAGREERRGHEAQPAGRAGRAEHANRQGPPVFHAH